ncbi:MAG: hypothetical protein EB127_27995, partial [Alphaproteobacteria bacterium]|nr:hypothetical protein [Alphaproteobacteria bacterium]
ISLRAVDGAYNLILNAGIGPINLGGVVGGNTPLNEFSVVIGSELNLGSGATSINAASCYINPSVTTNIAVNTAINTTGSSGITTGNFQGSSFTLFLNGANAGPVILTGGNTTLQSLTISGATQVNLGSSINTTSSLTINAPIVLLADISLNTTGVSAITLSGPVNATSAYGQSLSLIAGGAVSILGSIGDSKALAALTISAGSQLTFGSGTAFIVAGSQTYTAMSFDFNTGDLTTLNASTGSIIFNTGDITLGVNNSLTLIAATGVILEHLEASDHQLTNLTVNAGSGPFNFIRMGSSLNRLKTVDLTAVSYTPDYPIEEVNVFSLDLNIKDETINYLSGIYNISSSKTYNSPVILTGHVILNVDCTVGSGLVFNQSLNSQSGGNYNLTIQACGNQVIFNGTVGNVTPPGIIEIAQANDLQIVFPVTTYSLLQSNGSGTT